MIEIEYRIVEALRDMLHQAELEGAEWEYIAGLQAAYDRASVIADRFE